MKSCAQREGYRTIRIATIAMTVLLAVSLFPGIDAAEVRPHFRRLPDLRLNVFACAPDPKHQIFTSREELIRELGLKAGHCPAPAWEAWRASFLEGLDRAKLDWENESLMIVEEWYGTGMAKGSLSLEVTAPGVLAVKIHWRVPPPPLTPDTTVFRGGFAVSKAVTRIEITGRQGMTTVRGLPGV